MQAVAANRDGPGRRVEREPNARIVTDYDTEGVFKLLVGLLG